MVAHRLERSPAHKGNCPHCSRNKVWRYFEGFHGDERFGRCERINSCPSGGNVYYPDRTSKRTYLKEVIEVRNKQAFIPQMYYRNIMLDMSSNFHVFCRKLGISNDHLVKWGVGTDNGKTVFFFINHKKEIVNKKVGRYHKDGKRDKEFGFYSMRQPPKKYKYQLCLYGEHLIDGLDIAIVESEKTAILASWVYPNYSWVACSSANGLSDGSNGSADRISILKDRKVIWVCDADKAGRSNSSINNLVRYNINHVIMDFFIMRTDGYDIGDSIVDGIKDLL
ncbi:hypothetical protein HN803_07630 [candidate division WWE3 bacterium]|nr:hypothetical protein [candidate division WWE3 bacterium]